MFLNINVVRNAFIIFAVLFIQILFPHVIFFMYKLNRCKYMSFKKSVNLSLMKVPFSATGLFGDFSKIGLFSLMLFFFYFFKFNQR